MEDGYHWNEHDFRTVENTPTKDVWINSDIKRPCSNLIKHVYMLIKIYTLKYISMLKKEI